MIETMNRKPLTEQQFLPFLGATDWNPFEVPLQTLRCLVPRLSDTFAVMGSACPHQPRFLNGVWAIAGADVLAIERNPKYGEPEGNAYHVVLQQSGDARFPYIMHGPFRSETRVPHWFTYSDLDRYWR